MDPTFKLNRQNVSELLHEPHLTKSDFKHYPLAEISRDELVEAPSFSTN